MKLQRAAGSGRRTNTRDEKGKVRVQIVLMTDNSRGMIKGNITRTIMFRNAKVSQVKRAIEKLF